MGINDCLRIDGNVQKVLEVWSLKAILNLFWMCFVLTTTPGCGVVVGFLTEYDRDVTDKKEMWGGYEHKGIYEIKKYVFLEEVEDWTKKLVLVPPRDKKEAIGLMLWSAPNSIEEYTKYRTNWPEVLGVIDKGTRLQVVKFGQHGAWLWGSSIYIIAELVDGPHAGKIVDISDLSQLTDVKEKPYRLKPDSRVLERCGEIGDVRN